MRTNRLFCIFIAAVALLTATHALGAAAQRLDNRDAGRYDIKAERVFEGMITSKGHLIDGLMYFPLKTKNGVIEIQVGPEEFLTHMNFKIGQGDIVRVLGAPSVVNERDVILAREIRCTRGAIILREDDGAPIWETEQPIQMDTERRTSHEQC